MNNIKTHFYAVLLLLTLTTSCQNKKQDKEMNTEKFYWSEFGTSPVGYPIDVYEGGIGSASLKNGTTTGHQSR